MVQVKSGGTGSPPRGNQGRVKTFLFAASGSYGNVIPDNVEAIKPTTLRDFMNEQQQFLPDRVVNWVKIANAGPATTSNPAAVAILA